MSACSRWDGKIRMSHTRQTRTLPLHRRPRPLRRFYRLSICRRRGQTSMHVLQNDKGAFRRTSRRTTAMGTGSLNTGAPSGRSGKPHHLTPARTTPERPSIRPSRLVYFQRATRLRQPRLRSPAQGVRPVSPSVVLSLAVLLRTLNKDTVETIGTSNYGKIDETNERTRGRSVAETWRLDRSLEGIRARQYQLMKPGDGIDAYHPEPPCLLAGIYTSSLLNGGFIVSALTDWRADG
ncbi:hypothetical protein GWI33_000046 [Rhynchophorus ferrugineus]|uniref:Uncharacterized protein n=1 Tax=Rhynchophorus ferrugineus TaxID=354439 RepID=A0A834MMA0_RHYFE|nr:hypothetical protein GWI33_000046 [Rhynchophorus ferrugineus]